MCELTDETSLDPRLARYVFFFDDNDTPTNGAIIEGCAHRFKVGCEPAIVRLETAGSVKTELFRIEVAVGL